MKERKDELKLNAATPNILNNDYAYARMSENQSTKFMRKKRGSEVGSSRVENKGSVINRSETGMISQMSSEIRAES